MTNSELPASQPNTAGSGQSASADSQSGSSNANNSSAPRGQRRPRPRNASNEGRSEGNNGGRNRNSNRKPRSPNRNRSQDSDDDIGNRIGPGNRALKPPRELTEEMDKMENIFIEKLGDSDDLIYFDTETFNDSSEAAGRAPVG